MKKVIVVVGIVLIIAIVLIAPEKFANIDSVEITLSHHTTFLEIIGVVLLFVLLGTTPKFHQKRALNALYLESISLIEEAKKESFIEETREVLAKLEELRAELDNAYKGGNREQVSRIKEEISRYVSAARRVRSEYTKTKEDVINQIANILSIGATSGVTVSPEGNEGEG